MSLKLHNFGNFCMIQKVMRIKHGHVQNRKTFLFHSLVCHKQSLHKTITLKKLIHNSQFFLGFKLFFYLCFHLDWKTNFVCLYERAEYWSLASIGFSSSRCCCCCSGRYFLHIQQVNRRTNELNKWRNEHRNVRTNIQTKETNKRGRGGRMWWWSHVTRVHTSVC
jgi:hypothetical protein